MENKKIMGPE